MANQGGTAKAKDKEVTTPVTVNQTNERLRQKLAGIVSQRAFELYEANGARDGDDLSNWYQAESEVMFDVPEIHQSGLWYTINMPMPDIERENIYIGVDSYRALIAAEKHSDGSTQADGDSFYRENSMFLVARWNSDVDPSTASAYLKNGNLTLTVRQAQPA